MESEIGSFVWSLVGGVALLLAVNALLGFPF